MDFKEAYIAALEQELFELEYAGVPLNKAYELASRRSYNRMVEDAAGAIDELKAMYKEGM